MSTDMQTTRGNGGQVARTPDDTFKAQVYGAANKALVATLGSAQGQKAAMRVVLAFYSAIRNAKNPGDLMRCSPESIQACVANSAETSLMPGGPYPSVWLVPRAGQLRWEISHRGIISLAQRAGYGIRAIPVHVEDPVLVLAFGEVVEHDSHPDLYPTSLDDLRGVYVSITRLSDGASMGRPWVPVSLIRRRAESAQAGPVWKTWPVEMAIKTAIKYCMARGYITIDSQELDAALTAEGPTIDAEAEVTRTEPARPATAPPPGLRTEHRQIEESTDIIDGEATAPEPVTVQATPTPAELAAAESAYQDAHTPAGLVELRKRVTGATRGKDITPDMLPAYYAALTGEG